MTEITPKPYRPIWNVPNFLTLARILLSVALFAVMPFKLYPLAMVLFILASITDFLDGWWARKFHQVTKLGRIADPFADKLLVCGTLIYLVAIDELRIPCDALGGINVGIAPWMVVVVVSRELLVTLLRSMIEAGGGDFSAKMAGKLKMILQCVAVIAAFLYLTVLQTREDCPFLKGIEPLLKWSYVIAIWGTIYLTLDSCVRYIWAAVRASRASSESAS